MRYILLRDRPNAFSPNYWNSISQSSQNTRRIHGIALDAVYGFYGDGATKQFYLRKDWEKAQEFIVDRLFSRVYFEKISKLIKKAGQAAEKLLGKPLGNQPIKEALAIEKAWMDYDNANVPPWFWGGDLFSAKVKRKLGLSDEDFLVLTTPDTKTFTSQMEGDLLKGKSAQELSDLYGWIPFGYDGPEYWDKAYFERKLIGLAEGKRIRLLEIQKKELIERKRRIGCDSELIARINALTVWTDERKKVEFKLHYRYFQALSLIGKVLSVPVRNLKYLTTEELALGRDEILRRSGERISSPFMTKSRLGRIEFLSSSEMVSIQKELSSEHASEVSGIVASKGNDKIYRGTAQIVLSPKDSGKLRPGDFLVATMTSPDYIEAMGRAKGFITDEGGVTCHAAIVAREMGKPCIIGTGNATKVLKDGDLVEMDVEKGVVRKIA